MPFALFLVWPFFALIFAIVNWRSPWAKNIVWLFCGFFGFTFYIPPDGPDANRYRDYLIDFHYSGTDIWQYIPEVLMGKHGKGDILEPMLRGLIGHFTDDHRILFCVFGLIMGYFLSRNIWFLLEKAGNKIPLSAYPFLWVVAFGIGIWQINGFRFWTAAHIFIHGLIVLFYYRKKIKGSFLLILAAATHITMAIPIIAVALAVLMAAYPKILLIIMGLSMLFASIPVEKILTLLPKSLFPSADLYIKGYLMSDIAKNFEQVRESRIWFLRLNDISSRILFSFLAIYYLLRCSNFQFLSIGGRRLMTVGVLMLAIYNLFYLFPSIVRFATISFLIIAVVYFLYMLEQGNTLHKRWISLLALPPITLLVLIQWRIGLEFLGPSPIFTSPLFAWVLDALPGFK